MSGFTQKPGFPLVNGQMYSWASIDVRIAGVSVVGLRAITYQDAQDIEPIMGLGNKPIGAGEGNISYEGSITLLNEEIEALHDASPDGRIQRIDFFDIIVSYEVGSKITTHKLKRCKFKESGRSASQGDTMLESELPLFISDIEWR